MREYLSLKVALKLKDEQITTLLHLTFHSYLTVI